MPSASGSVPSDSRTRGTCRRRSSRCVVLAAVLRPRPGGRRRRARRGPRSRSRKNTSAGSASSPRSASSTPTGAQLLAGVREDPHQVVLVRLAHPGQLPHPAAARTGTARGAQRGTGAAHPSTTPRDGRLGRARPAGEHGVGSQVRVLEPQVVGQHAEHVGRVVGPSRHAEVDLGDGPVPVPGQEPGEPVLQSGRQRRAVAVSAGQLGRRGRRAGPRPSPHRHAAASPAPTAPGPSRWSSCAAASAAPRSPRSSRAPARASAGAAPSASEPGAGHRHDPRHDREPVARAPADGPVEPLRAVRRSPAAVARARTGRRPGRRAVGPPPGSSQRQRDHRRDPEADQGPAAAAGRTATATCPARRAADRRTATAARPPNGTPSRRAPAGRARGRLGCAAPG